MSKRRPWHLVGLVLVALLLTFTIFLIMAWVLGPPPDDVAPVPAPESVIIPEP